MPFRLFLSSSEEARLEFADEGFVLAVGGDDDAKFFAFRRELDGRRVFVAFNRGENAYEWAIPEELAVDAEILFTTDRSASLKRNSRGDGQ